MKPNFTGAYLATASVPFNKIIVTDEMVEEEITRLPLRHVNMTELESVPGDDNVLNVQFIETDATGKEIEGGASKENSLLVKYFSEAFRPSLMDKKNNDVVNLQLNQAFEPKEREWVLGDLGFAKDDTAAGEKYFNMVITKVGLVEKSLLEEPFFKTVFPGKEIADEATFRDAIREDIQSQFDAQSKNQLSDTIYHFLLDKTTISFPDTFLKRWIQSGGEQAKTEEEAEKEYPSFSNSLKWTLIVDQLVKDHNIEVKPEDLREFAKAQLFSYMGNMNMGEMNIEQPWVNDYVERMMKDRKFVEDSFHRIQTEKIFGLAESLVKKDEKPVSLEAFQKMQAEHHHH